MNAHQRRVNRRSYRYVTFDLESIPCSWGTIEKVVVLGDFFDFSSVRPRGERLSNTTTAVKERDPIEYAFSVFPYIALHESPEQRAKRELGFHIEGVEP
jgi:hypothetical protein